MRTSAFAVAILTLASLATALSAEDDFSALLADLSFGDEEHVTVATPESLVLVQPTPAEGATQLEKALALSDMTIAGSEFSSRAAAPVALQDPVAVPLPQKSIQPDASDLVNFNAAFDLQEPKTYSEIPAQPACHALNRCTSPGCDACDPVTVIECTPLECTPHVIPNLPSSTLQQYFRSNKCNVHVWDGYQQHCFNVHVPDCNLHKMAGKCSCPKKHIRRCDCDDCVGYGW